MTLTASDLRASVNLQTYGDISPDELMKTGIFPGLRTVFMSYRAYHGSRDDVQFLVNSLVSAKPLETVSVSYFTQSQSENGILVRTSIIVNTVSGSVTLGASPYFQNAGQAGLYAIFDHVAGPISKFVKILHS